MARKSMKDAAAAGTSVFNQIASGNAQNAQDVTNVQNTKGVKNVQNAKDVKSGRPSKYEADMQRLNLKIPTEIKEYLAVAAAKESIAQRRSISLTEYLIELIKADMEKNK